MSIEENRLVNSIMFLSCVHGNDSLASKAAINGTLSMGRTDKGSFDEE